MHKELTGLVQSSVFKKFVNLKKTFPFINRIRGDKYLIVRKCIFSATADVRKVFKQLFEAWKLTHLHKNGIDVRSQNDT